MSLFDQIQEATSFLQEKTNSFSASTGIILGTGLSGLADQLTDAQAIPYGEIPHFPKSTVESHRGQLLFGKLAGKPVFALAGRFHYYEGYSMQQVTFPIRVLRALGATQMIISNAAGSVNADMEAGDLVFVSDHINLQPENPLRGPNDERLGPRFPDMMHAYNPEWIRFALSFAQGAGIRAHRGIYAGLQGPNLETPAEYQFLHTIGADLVGMSTVPEVIVARHAGMNVFVCSIVSNKCYPLSELTETTVEEVIAVAQEATPKLEKIVAALVAEFA
ncbi:MAG: purine-nucleoside phosphorylase [Saprospiraceae bacterium]|nr:purine-nucleoside phosphorylase [Saprospiraceae bacterium]